ncbi:MAG TPA: PAS domain S-box protein [Spirochaetia bacterium]|nr:PAS domain S-box protein [Spirochaetia bacterium]
MDGGVSRGHGATGSSSSGPIWIPLALCALGVGFFGSVHSGGTWLPPLLFTGLNVVFITTASLLVAGLAGVSFWYTGEWTMLFLGGGALSLGLGGVMAGFPVSVDAQNYTVTVYNSSAFLAACLHFLGGVTYSMETPSREAARSRSVLAMVYAATVALVVALIGLERRGVMPRFFVPGSGGTFYDVAVLWGAAALFVASASLLLLRARGKASDFNRWYSFGLLLFAVGMIGVSLQTRMGSPLNWVSRVSQYIGGAYMVIGVLISGKDRGSWSLRLERALRESERRYENLMNLSPDAILVHARGFVVYANPAAARLAGVPTAAELLGVQILSVVSPEDRAHAQERIRREYRGETLPLTETRYLRRDGSIVEVETTGGPVEWEGEPAIQVLVRDITERKRIQKELQAHAEWLHVAQVAAKAGAWEWDLETDRNRWSEELWNLYGLVPNSADLTHQVWLSVVHPEDRERVERREQEAIRAGETMTVEWRLRSDPSRWVLSQGESVRDNSGKIIRMIGVAMDITDRKRSEEALLAAERRLLHSQRLESLGVLAGGVAHDFNNILQAILGNAELAAARLPADSAAHENLRELSRSAQRAADLTRQMLAYSGRGRFEVQPLDLSDVIMEMQGMLRISVSRKATIDYTLAPGLSPILADLSQLRQIVMNLVINASEALGESTGRITLVTGSIECDESYLSAVWSGEQLSPGRYVYLEVTDTGAGMDENTRVRIFEPFFTTKFTGRGLGLAAVLGIVQGHNGAIKVYSEPEKGSTFKLLFPAVEASPRELRHDVACGEWQGHGTLLLVDDEEHVRNVARQMLEHLGFCVLMANDGRGAVEALRAHRDDIVCVILDLTMPTMDGEEAFRQMRQMVPSLKVILSSGFNEQTIIQQWVGRGLAGFIQKPYHLSTLELKLREVLGA